MSACRVIAATMGAHRTTNCRWASKAIEETRIRANRVLDAARHILQDISALQDEDESGRLCMAFDAFRWRQR